MGRYFVKSAHVVSPCTYDGFAPMDDEPGRDTLTVHEDDLETWTGIVDAKGREIHRSERIVMGFQKEASK